MFSTILIFFAVLFVLVIVHEFGHFIVAKKSGMRVDEFGFGFPPRLFSIKKGETTYSFNALPIGGFVKIHGEDALLQDESERKEGSESADFERSFIAKPRWKQALVLVAGVAMNFLLAWVIFATMFAIGTPEFVPEDTARDSAKLTVVQLAPESPASDAGIPIGAEIESVIIPHTDQTLTDIGPAEFQALTEQSAENELVVTYTIDDVSHTVTLIPETGFIPNEPERAIVGVSLAMVETVAYPVHIAVWKGLVASVTSLRDVTVGILEFFADAFRANADLSQVAGPVGLVGIVGDATDQGLMTLARLTAFISLNLVVINLLPFPALDGGRLLFVAIEAIRRKALPAKFVLYSNAAGFLFLLGLMLVVTISDIGKLL